MLADADARDSTSSGACVAAQSRAHAGRVGWCAGRSPWDKQGADARISPIFGIHEDNTTHKYDRSF
jgi:hypothetical protein